MVHPLAPQILECVYYPRLRRYLTYHNVYLEDLIDDHEALEVKDDTSRLVRVEELELRLDLRTTITW